MGVLDAPSTPRAAGIDALTIQRLNDRGAQTARRYGGQAQIDYAEATELVEPWANLTNTLVNSRVQVSGNRLYGTADTTNPSVAYLPFAVTVGQKFHITTRVTLASLKTGAIVYLGIDMNASNSTANAASQPDAISVGFTQTGNLAGIAGSNVSTNVAPPGNTTPWTPTPGDYLFDITGDEDFINFTIRSVTDNTKHFVWGFLTSALTGMGKSIGRIMCYVSDDRGTSGHSMGPVVAVKGSMQPTRTKAAGGITVEGITYRDFRKYADASKAEIWRYSLPADYDPRKPAPLAIYLHAAQVISTTSYDRPWAQGNEQPLTKALNDAGYIVACGQDGYIVGQPNTDRYGNAASMANQLALYQYMRNHFNIGPVVLYGPSMGGLTGTNLLARRTIPNIAAAYFICPSIDLDVPHGNPTYAGPIRAAFGVASDDSDYAAKTAGYNSMARAGWEFRGVPVRMVAGASDTVAPPASHIDPFITKLTPYVPEASKLVVAGANHLDSTCYSASDLMSFLGRHVFV